MKKNIYLFITIGLLLVFTLVYFVSANKISYAFSYDETEVLYENRINTINKMAEMYAQNNPDLFNEKNDIYVTVNELIEKNYLLPDDEDGNYNDPTSSVKTLNDIKIRITKTGDNTYKTKILK